jgi:hypothetical protein
MRKIQVEENRESTNREMKEVEAYVKRVAKKKKKTREKKNNETKLLRTILDRILALAKKALIP